MTKIYVDHISPRIEFTFEFIFGLRGLAYEFVNDRYTADFIYSSNCLASEPTIKMANFMLSDQLDSIIPKVVQYTDDLQCLSFDEVFDPIASIFYTLTRYEEYTCQKRDEFGRFPLEESVSPISWLTQSMCDRWAEKVLGMINIDPSSIKNEGDFIPTFDIDNTFAYRLKEGKVKFGSIAKDLARFDKKRLQERKMVLNGELNDPYDTFDKIRSIKKRFPTTKVFWLIGKRGTKDRNISIDNLEHQNLIKSLVSEGIAIGLHPSFDSFGNKAIISEEKKKLENVIGDSISHSRQHFLRFRMGTTYSDLRSIGFTDEYSMGYAEHIGFRAGTARPHRWFDLVGNKVTDFIIHPFAYMDGTLREYMDLTIDESKLQIRNLYQEVKRYGGDFIFIWHNETIGDYGKWKGWSEVLEFTLSLEHESS